MKDDLQKLTTGPNTGIKKIMVSPAPVTRGPSHITVPSVIALKTLWKRGEKIIKTRTPGSLS